MRRCWVEKDPQASLLNDRKLVLVSIYLALGDNRFGNGGITMAALVLPTPFGSLTLIGTEAALTGIRFGKCAGDESLIESAILRHAAEELTA